MRTKFCAEGNIPAEGAILMNFHCDDVVASQEVCERSRVRTVVNGITNANGSLSIVIHGRGVSRHIETVKLLTINIHERSIIDHMPKCHGKTCERRRQTKVITEVERIVILA